MLIKEYRVTLPFTVEEYQIGQLFTVAETSKSQTGDGEGIEVITSEPFANKPLFSGKFDSGWYSHKIYHVNQKVPSMLRRIMPFGSLQLHEESWNAYPYIRTIFTNPISHKGKVIVTVESMHLPDRGEEENVHELPPNLLQMREVVYIDVGNDRLSEDIPPDENPSTFVSLKTGRGPFSGKWRDTVTPVMTCYKLVTADFKLFGFQRIIESLIHKYERKIFTSFHRQVICWMDKWLGMSLAEIRVLEDQTKDELNRQMKENGPAITPSTLEI